jgi:coenzyme F420 hydrogenase subunit beta
MLSVDELLGPHVACYVGYTTDSTRLKNAASGGVVGTVIDYVLANGLVSAVLASRLEIVAGKLEPVPVLARSVQELAACRNSIYLDFNLGARGMFHAVLDEMSQPGRRVAVVGLFCHLTHLASLMERRGIARDRLLAIGLFCSHAPERELLDKVLARQGADLERAVAYHTKTGSGGRDGRLHGRSTLEYADGTKLDFPFIEFTTFKNSWFYTPKKCLVCPDQFSEIADISCGDAWYKEIRGHPNKQTTVVVRNARANALILRMVREGHLALRHVDPVAIVRSQRRVAGGRASLPARIALAKRWNIKLPPVVTGTIRIRDRLHSLMMLGPVQISSKPRVMSWIMRLPTPIVLVYTLLLKLVEQTLVTGLPKSRGVGLVVTGAEEGSETLSSAPSGDVRTADDIERGRAR